MEHDLECSERAEAQNACSSTDIVINKEVLVIKPSPSLKTLLHNCISFTRLNSRFRIMAKLEYEFYMSCSSIAFIFLWRGEGIV